MDSCEQARRRGVWHAGTAHVPTCDGTKVLRCETHGSRGTEEPRHFCSTVGGTGVIHEEVRPTFLIGKPGR